jgi:hypothetical protein
MHVSSLIRNIGVISTLTFLLSASSLADTRSDWNREASFSTPFLAVNLGSASFAMHSFAGARDDSFNSRYFDSSVPLFERYPHYGIERRPLLSEYLQNAPASAPEPATLGLLATGLFGIATLLRRRIRP